jgi:hypothetical protein
MTVSELKYRYKENNPDGHFFDYKTMRFFGDTMHNFGVYGTEIWDPSVKEHIDVWVLYRRGPVNGGLHGVCAYFSKADFHEVHRY